MKSKKNTEPAPPPAASPRKTSLFTVLFVLAALIAGGLIWYYRNHVISGGCCSGDNVLLITLDTTRADHLPVYGYKDVKTPNLDGFAQDAFVFDAAISHVPITLSAHASILTGKLPLGHGIRDNGGYILDHQQTTLAEILKQHGFTTAAFVSAYVLDSHFGLNQGFDTYDDTFSNSAEPATNGRDIQRRGEETVQDATTWLNTNGKSHWFMWVHLYDPHNPYEPPEPYHTEYASHLYDGEIAYTDEMVGRILKKVEEVGARDHTIVVITADHGESLGEHKEATHAMFVYNPTQKVPLIIHVPGSRSKRVRAAVGHVDLVPTLLDWLNITAPSGLQGNSLTAVINGTDRGQRAIYSESLYAELHYGWSPLQSVTTDHYRYIDAPHPELYDWRLDPGESHNLIQEKASIARVLKERLQETIAKDSTAQPPGPQKIDAETEEKLRSLGYVGGGATSTEESRKIDPKDKIHLAVAVQQASGYSLAGQQRKALETVLPVLNEDPGMMEAHYVAGVAYAATQQYPKAIDELLQTVRMKPDNIMAIYNLAFAYQMTGDYKSAEYWYLKVLQQDPEHISTISKLAALYMQTRQPDRAVPYLQKALKHYDDLLQKATNEKTRAALYAYAAELYFVGGDLKQAAASLSTALKLDPTRPLLHYNLGQVYDSAGATDQAMDEYKREIANNPKAFEAFYNLGSIFFEKGRYQDAAKCFEKVVQLNPNVPAYRALAESYRKSGRAQEADRILSAVQDQMKAQQH